MFLNNNITMYPYFSTKFLSTKLGFTKGLVPMFDTTIHASH
jgi:hypothetical protein